MDEGETRATADEAPRYGSALLALTAAATMVAAAFGGTGLALAGGSDTGHTLMVYLLAQANHDIGHNDWAFQGRLSGLIGSMVVYGVLGVCWLGVALWMRAVGRRHGSPAPWRRVLIAAWLAELVAGTLCLAAVYGAEHTSSAAGPVLLRVADACSPWWACAAALLALASAQRGRTLTWAAAGYGALLLLLLLVPLPGPAWIRILILAATAAGPAAAGASGPAAPTTSGPAEAGASGPAAPAVLRSDAAAAG
jgi:hypothetical protein